MRLKQILTNQSGHESNGNEEILPLLRSPELEAHYQKQFRIIPRTSHSGGEDCFSAKDTVSVSSASTAGWLRQQNKNAFFLKSKREITKS